MKVVVLYRPNSAHSRRIEEFIREYTAQYEGKQLQVLNIDRQDGAAMASLYDVMQYPAIMVLQNDGYQHKLWQGEDLPLMSEVAGYARQ